MGTNSRFGQAAKHSYQLATLHQPATKNTPTKQFWPAYEQRRTAPANAI